MRGTPYLYQGEEIGMTNAGFTDLSQYRDVESLNRFRILRDKGMSQESAYNILKVHSRDNARTPMQWDSSENGGFTGGTPWISVNPNCEKINAASQVDDPDPENPSVLAYRRSWEGTELLCVSNFYRKPCTWKCPVDLEGYRVLLANYPDPKPEPEMALRPYESMILLRRP